MLKRDHLVESQHLQVYLMNIGEKILLLGETQLAMVKAKKMLQMRIGVKK